MEQSTIIGANITADKQITVSLRYKGNESSPPITVEAGAVKFNLADFLSIFKAMMMMVGMRSLGVSGEGLNMSSLFKQSNNYSFAKSSFNSSSSDLSGKSKLNSEWQSPATVIVELAGNASLNDVNFIGIRVVGK
jgi:hypothetical protein